MFWVSLPGTGVPKTRGYDAPSVFTELFTVCYFSAFVAVNRRGQSPSSTGRHLDCSSQAKPSVSAKCPWGRVLGSNSVEVGGGGGGGANRTFFPAPCLSLPHGHFESPQVLLAVSNQDGGSTNSTIDRDKHQPRSQSPWERGWTNTRKYRRLPTTFSAPLPAHSSYPNHR